LNTPLAERTVESERDIMSGVLELENDIRISQLVIPAILECEHGLLEVKGLSGSEVHFREAPTYSPVALLCTTTLISEANAQSK